ncbi:hypothetical protein QQS21_011198 [Conoideocrella luteorostrata]|uniref:ABC transporter n=1 Tax=Conoideocrella luteorostrata TaxID=1105319 RepID=A0AAJ0CDJ8_9HYPO|nr:hypothetical protein QQS21_011198 [Conoideocrella luteorostrata]
MMNAIVKFVGTSNESHRPSHVGGLVGATVLVYLGIAISRCHYMHCTYRLITAVRGGLVALIFSKAIDLDVATAKESAAVTLMSTDIDGVASGLQKIHDIWASLIELGLGIYLLQLQVGAACFLILIPGVLSSFATARVARGMGPARILWNEKVQKRVATTSSALSQIKGIKVMGLPERICDLIQSLRVVELNSSKAFRLFFVWMNMIANLSDQITPAIIIAAAVFWTKGSSGLSIAEAFTSLSVVTLVSTPLVNIIAAYPTFVTGLACFSRVQAFLLDNERLDYRSTSHSPPKDNIASTSSGGDIELRTTGPRPLLAGDSKSACPPAIHIHGASIALKSGQDAILSNINLDISSATLAMIVGPVGCGKSTLLKVILSEAQLLRGKVDLGLVPIAFCDQTPWLRFGSIRDNILGPNIYDEKWYRTVLWACALEQDLAQLDDGDVTSVGSEGNSLSGGQKQRLALARAVYARCPLELLDNVFSALDQDTSREIFSRLLGTNGLLRTRQQTIILATHTVEHLPAADIIIALDGNGSVVSRSAPEDLKLDETYIVGLAGDDRESQKGDPDCASADKSPGQALAKTPLTPELTRRVGDLSLYRFYLQSVGIYIFIVWLVLAAGYIFSGRLPQIWLRIWTEHGTTKQKEAYFGTYVAFGLLFFMIVAVPKSAQHLHWLLLRAVFRAPLWFFTSTDASVILNRFSQDMTLVDQVLPMSVFTTTFDVFNVIAGAALIASGATYVAAIIPFCIIAIYFIQKFYLRTSRQMRHLDLEAKTPLYRLFTETAAGVMTIRAFGWKTAMAEENLRLLEHSQKPYYTMLVASLYMREKLADSETFRYCIQRWLNVVLDLLVAAIAVVLVGFALGFSGSATQGSIGLALLNVMEFNQSLSMLINSWTGLETSLGAIARLKTFMAETQTEGLEAEDKMPPSSWPQRGKIHISDLTAKYNRIEDSQPQSAIRDINLDIQPGQKVALVGRTGSGKSSLLLTLLHLLEISSGAITIDGEDLSRIPRQTLRQRILTIPQDVVELPGSVRDNMTLFESLGKEPESGDDLMQYALERVGLWDIVNRRGGLITALDEVGLSAGQKQLFALARTIFTKQKSNSKSGILLMDEPASSVDEPTNEKMRAIIAGEFTGYTVLTISHRVDAGKDADVVVRLDSGSVVEVMRR